MLLRYLMMGFHLMSRYSMFVIYIICAVVGVILSKKSGKADSVRIGVGILILAIACVAENFMPALILSKHMNQTVRFVVYYGAFVLRLIAMVVAFAVFFGYRLTKWIGVLFIIVLVVGFFYNLFTNRMIFGMGDAANGVSKSTTFLMAFFNNGSALNFVRILLSFVPTIALCIDGFITVHNND